MQMCGLKWVNDNQIRNALNIARHRTCADRNMPRKLLDCKLHHISHLSEGARIEMMN